MADSKISEEPTEVKASKIPVAQARSDVQSRLGPADGNATLSQRSTGQVVNSVIPVSSTSTIQQSNPSQRQIPTSIDGVLEGTQERPMKSGSSTPSWPTSPRLKSPPPSATRNSTSRREGSEQQPNTAKRLAAVSAPELAAAMLMSDTARDQAQGQPPSSHLRVPGRGSTVQTGGLETVVEGSVPTTPSASLQPNPMDEAQPEHQNVGTVSNHKLQTTSETKETETKDSAALLKVNINKPDSEPKTRTTATARMPSANLSKKSYTSLTGNKKPGMEPLRTMTVETEEVNTTTPMLIDRNRDGSSVRTKTSTETIRPKKEKKKTSRKPASIHAGVGTSKADIFEAKVASAVDEVDSDDSDETFVYESNPPEPRSQHQHSRSPSATSMTSTNDHSRPSKYHTGSGNGAMLGKRSMKFSNSLHREYDDDQTRNPSRNVSSTPRHHHIGRHGRNHNHPSLFDNTSPFSQSHKPLSPRTPNVSNKALQTSRPNSPRIGNARLTSPRKYGTSAYDNNEDVADDERAPLIGSVRVARNRHSRRPHSRDFRSLELGEETETSLWSRCSGCLILVLLLLLICIGVATFVVVVNRPLYEVEIRRITNVLASEQELMLDLDIKAINPNLFGITVTELDVNLFAESPYVGTTADWHKTHPNDRRLSISERRKRSWFWPTPRPNDGVDEGTDPEDPDPGIQKMLLGQITEFDSPLVFDPTPLRHNVVSSVGEIRLAKPGNKTEIGGSERWERVLHHDFDLIVRGVIRYQLPLSSKMRSAKISGSKTVHPAGEERNKTQVGHD